MQRQVSSLSRLRHPHLLHIIEPLEETRTTLSWASESIIGSLDGVLQSAQAAAKLGGKAGRLLGEGAGGGGMGGMEIDEVEVNASECMFERWRML
jgi:SCY1-like protein 2